MSDDTVEFNKSGLEGLLKALKAQGGVAKVGILGQSNARSGKGSNSNATIGAAHEFGTSKLPQRSFLRMPISDHLPKELEKAGAFTEDALKQVMKSGSFLPYVEKIAITAVSVVMVAFDSNGYGTWAALKPATLEHKKIKQTLVETQQLRNSISYEIK